MREAMALDPSVFAYDEVYDDMKATLAASDPRVQVKKEVGVRSFF
jgi:hypothetical protein